MFWRNAERRPLTVTFRLTIWYTAAYTVLSLAVFALFSVMLTYRLDSRLDEELQGEMGNLATLYEKQGTEKFQAQIGSEVGTPEDSTEFLVLLSPRDEILASSNLAMWKWMDFSPPFIKELQPNRIVRKTIAIPGQEYSIRMVALKVADGSIIERGVSRKNDEELLEGLGIVFSGGIALMLASGSFLGWFMTRRAMAGVERVSTAAARIGEKDLSLRVSVGAEGEEITKLALTFNAMLDRIETLVRQFREMSDSIAHDLRSPITGIRGMAEAMLGGQHTSEAFREMAGQVISESDRLVGIINTMLEITRAESALVVPIRLEVNMADIVVSASDLFQPVAEESGIRLTATAAGEILTVLGDKSQLQRVVANMMDNAIKYTPRGGTVQISTNKREACVIIAVTDSGPGIPEQEQSRIFERFYRGDKSRTAQGSGLGLSLALAFARAHGGDITVASHPGTGSTFMLILPAAAPSSTAPA